MVSQSISRQIYTPMELTIIKCRTVTQSQQCRAVMDEKSSPIFPVCRGAVVTNGWCIIDR